MNNYCDLTCKYARFPDKLCDGSMTCRTFVAMFCTKKKRIVYKNKECKVYEKTSKELI